MVDLSRGELDLIFTALADPTRRAILERLAQGATPVSELASPFDMALPTVLGHIKRLEDAGLITTEKDGRVRTCALRAEAFEPVQDWLSSQRSIWEARLDRLDDYIIKLMKDRENGL